MSTLLQAANDVSLKKKVQLFFALNFLLTMITAAGLFYVLYEYDGESAGVIVSLCVILLVLLTFQAAAMVYIRSYIVKPLTEMQVASRLMVEGHLETLNYVQRKDEIGSLGENINDLATNMQEVLLTVWNHSRSSRELLESITSDLDFVLDREKSSVTIENTLQKDIKKMHYNNEHLRSIVMSFSYFEIKLEDEKMVSDYQQDSAVTSS